MGGPRPPEVVAERNPRGLSAWLRRLSMNVTWAVRAILRRETIVFEIGRPFIMGDRVWICTDVGSRTICAVLRDALIESRDLGPPYSVAESALDRYSMDGCVPLVEDPS